MPNGILVFNTNGKLDRTYFLSNSVLTLLQDTRHQFAVPPGSTAIDAVKDFEQKTWPGRARSKIVETEVLVGKYYRGIARPIYRLDGAVNGLMNPGAERELGLVRNILREIEVLTQDLEHCFNVNSPFEKNWVSYGIYYERIIYMACIGVEAIFRKILEDNSIDVSNANMNLFVKLKPFLRLEEFSVRLQRYPWLRAVIPFAGWNANNPTKTLEWYNAYNLLKHDKRRNETVASMKHAISSVAAYYSIAYSSFGQTMFPTFFSDYYYFLFEAFPQWDVSECYLESDEKQWSPISITL
jgi:hypothetical protein